MSEEKKPRGTSVQVEGQGTTVEKWDESVKGQSRPPASDETTQLRAEVALLRAVVQEQVDRNKKTEEQKQKEAEFLAWIGLPTQVKTQKVADKLFTAAPGDQIWEVELQEHPKVKLPAHSEYEAVGRYSQLCGITSTQHKYTAVPVSTQPAGV